MRSFTELVKRFKSSKSESRSAPVSSYGANSGVGLGVSSKVGSGAQLGEVPDTKAQPETLGYTLIIASEDGSGMTHLETCNWSPGTKLRLTDGGQRYSFGTAGISAPTSFTYDPEKATCKPHYVPISIELTDGTVRKYPILLPIPPPGAESTFTLKKDGSVFRDGEGGYIGRLRPIDHKYSYDSTGEWNPRAWPGRQ